MTTYTLDELEELEVQTDHPDSPNTNGHALRPVQQRNRRMARRALLAKLTYTH